MSEFGKRNGTKNSTTSRGGAPSTAVWRVFVLVVALLGLPVVGVFVDAEPADATVAGALPPTGCSPDPVLAYLTACWDVNPTVSGSASVGGSVGAGQRATVTISPAADPCGDLIAQNCFYAIEWGGIGGFRCPVDGPGPDGAKWELCDMRTEGGTVRAQAQHVPGEGCLDAGFNGTYAYGGPLGETWPERAPRSYTCTFGMPDDANLVNLGGQTWLIGNVLIRSRTPILDEYGTYLHANFIHFAVPVDGSMHPHPSFTSTTDDLTVSFTNLTVGEPGHALSYLWDFGDGTTSTAASPAHTYATPGGYSVMLTVTDQTVSAVYEPAYRRTTSAGLFVDDPDRPTASIAVAELAEPGQYRFTATSTDPADSPLTHEWNIDGTAASGPSVTHTFDLPGERWVSLVSTNTSDLSDSTGVSVEVPAPELSVELDLPDGTEVDVGETFQLDVVVAASDDGVGALSEVLPTGDALVMPDSIEIVSAPAGLEPGDGGDGDGGGDGGGGGGDGDCCVAGLTVASLEVASLEGFTGLTLEPGESTTLTWELRAVEAGPFTLSSEWAGYDADGSEAGPTNDEISGVAGAGDLVASIEVDPDKAAPGEEIAITITVTNAAADTVEDIVVELDAEWDPEEDSLEEPTVSAVTPATATAPPDGEVEFTATVTAPAPGRLTLLASASGTTQEFGASVVSSQVDVEVEISADAIVNSTGDAGDDDPGDGACDTGEKVFVDAEEVAECTLRAAIQEANAGEFTDSIEFGIPTTSPTITPDSELPSIAGPLLVDGTTQDGGFVVLGGASAGDGASGLTAEGEGVELQGLVVNSFGGAGIVLAGDGGHSVRDSYFGRTPGGAPAVGNVAAGILVRSVGNRIEDNELAGNGTSDALPEPEPGFEPESIESGLSELTANIVLEQNSAATIDGNEIGDTVGIVAVGVTATTVNDNRLLGSVGVIAGATGPTAVGLTISDNTIGASAESDDAEADGVGVIVIGGGVEASGNTFVHRAVGVLAASVTSGSPLVVTGNTIEDAGIGVFLAGVAGAQVEQNDISGGIGVLTVGDVSPQTGHNVVFNNDFTSMIGAILIAEIGDEIRDNTFAAGSSEDNGTVGLVLVATAQATVVDNDFAANFGAIAIGVPLPAFGRSSFSSNTFEGDLGLFVVGEDATEIDGNTFSDTSIGLFLSASQASKITSNTATGGVVPMALFNVGGAEISDNKISGAALAVLVAASEPDDELPADASFDADEVFGEVFDGSVGDAALAWVQGSQDIVEIDHTTIYRSPISGARNIWTGNELTDNKVGLLAVGAVNANEIGGTNAGDANTITGNSAIGIGLGGVPAPQDVTIRGNRISGNGAAGFDEIAAGVPDLRLLPAVPDLPASAWATQLVNDPGDSDSGANGLQNHPVIKSVAADGSSVAGELWSTPSGSFLVDLYAASTCHPSGFGGAERYLGEVFVSTDSAGRGTFDAPIALAPGEVVTATATPTGAFADGGTSEFSRCGVLGQVGTVVSSDAESGDDRVEVSDDSDVELGDDVVIDPNGPNEEVATVTGFGSLIFSRSLTRPHQAGELVLVVPKQAPVDPGPVTPVPPTPTPGQAPTPAATPTAATPVAPGAATPGSTVGQPTGTLPETGGHPLLPAVLGMLMLAAGVVLRGAGRTRRRAV